MTGENYTLGDTLLDMTKGGVVGGVAGAASVAAPIIAASTPVLPGTVSGIVTGGGSGVVTGATSGVIDTVQKGGSLGEALAEGAANEQ